MRSSFFTKIRQLVQKILGAHTGILCYRKTVILLRISSNYVNHLL
jgi:hypothetical protein